MSPGRKLLEQLQRRKALPTDRAFAVLALMSNGAQLWRSTIWESGWWMTGGQAPTRVHHKVASSLLNGGWIQPGASDESGRREHTITMKGAAALVDLERFNLDES